MKTNAPVNTSLFTEEKSGLSMAEAQSLAEKAKNIAELDEQRLQTTGPYRKTMLYKEQELAVEDPKVLTKEELLRAAQAGRYYGLVAYLKEAIKAKSAWLTAVELADTEEFFEGDEALPAYPERPVPPAAPRLEEASLADVKRDMTPEAFAEYLVLESEVAHLGQKIHPGKDGNVVYAIAHAKQGSRFETKTMRDQGGLTDFPLTVQPAYQGAASEAATEAYIELHDLHREGEKKLNYYKASHKNELSDRQRAAQRTFLEATEAHQAELKKVQLAYQEAIEHHTQETRRLKALARERQEAEINRVSKLRIVVPAVLEPALSEVRDFDGRSAA